MRATDGITGKDFNTVESRAGDAYMLSEKTVKRVAWVAVLMLAAFLVGFVPGWLSANGHEFERDKLIREARAAEIRRMLASAAMYASVARYDDSLERAGEFFNAARMEIESAESAFGTEEKTALGRMLEQRVDLIATIARGEPSAAERLNAWYLELEKLRNAASAPGN